MNLFRGKMAKKEIAWYVVFPVVLTGFFTYAEKKISKAEASRNTISF
jgi:hypothetical protein